MYTKIINDEIFGIVESESDFEKYLLDSSSNQYKKYKNYVLETDINWDLINKKVKIYKFTGIFEGSNHTIYNWNINTEDYNSYVGLFGTVEDSKISNVNLNVKGILKGRNCISSFVGIAFNSFFYNININGNLNINTVRGYNLGLFAGELNDSYCRNIKINFTTSIIRGLYNIGGFSGILINTKIFNSNIEGNLNILGIDCHYARHGYFEYIYINTLDELFQIYFKDELKNDPTYLKHLNILKLNGYTYEKFLKMTNIELFKYNFKQQYILQYLSVRDKENEERYFEKIFRLNYLSKSIGGFLGYCKDSLIENVKLDYEGSIISEENVGGFTGTNESSCFINCSVNINGTINSLQNIGIFCGKEILNEKRSQFENSRIGTRTKINGILVDINNYFEYRKICETDYYVKFFEYLYPKYIYNLYNIKNIFNGKTILYQLFDHILTINQMLKLKIEKVTINSENQILYHLKKIFSSKWEKLNYQDQYSLSQVGFNKETFDCLDFPDKKWSQLSGKERIYAVKLGFNQKIWDYNFVEEIISFNANFDQNNKFTIDSKIRNILKFSINIDKLNLKVEIPTILRNIILIEIKRELIEFLNYRHINVYYSDEKNFDIVAIISSQPNEMDIVTQPLTNLISDNFEKIEEKELYTLVKLNMSNTFDLVKYFECNIGHLEDIIRNISSIKTCLPLDKITIKKYNINNFMFIINYTVTKDRYNDILEYNLKDLTNDEIVNLINTNINFTFENYNYFTSDTIDNLLLKYNRFLEPNRFSLSVIDNFMTFDFNNKNRFFTLYCKFKLNNEDINNDFEIIAFIGKKILYRNIVTKGINILKIPGTCDENLLLFKLYHKVTETIFDINIYNSKDKLNIYAIKNKNYGSKEKPLLFESKGLMPKNIIESNLDEKLIETDNIPYCIVGQVFFNNMINQDCSLLFYSNNQLKGIMKPNSSGYVEGTIESSGNKRETFVIKLYVNKLNGFAHFIDNKLILENENTGNYFDPIIFNAYAKDPIDPEEYFFFYYNIAKEPEPISESSIEESVIEESSEKESNKSESEKEKCADKKKFIWNINSNNVNKNDNRCMNIGCDNFDCNKDKENIYNFYNWDINESGGTGGGCCEKPFEYHENNYTCNHTNNKSDKYYISLYRNLKNPKNRNLTESENCHS